MRPKGDNDIIGSFRGTPGSSDKTLTGDQLVATRPILSKSRLEEAGRILAKPRPDHGRMAIFICSRHSTPNCHSLIGIIMTGSHLALDYTVDEC